MTRLSAAPRTFWHLKSRNLGDRPRAGHALGAGPRGRSSYHAGTMTGLQARPFEPLGMPDLPALVVLGLEFERRGLRHQITFARSSMSAAGVASWPRQG